MLKKTILTAAAALAITAGATTISTPDANAGAKSNVTFGNSNTLNYGRICHDHYRYKAIKPGHGFGGHVFGSYYLRCHKHLNNYRR